MSDRGLTQEALVHVDGGAVDNLLQGRDLSDRFVDEGLSGVVAFDFESCRVVSSVLHTLETGEEGFEDETTVLCAEFSSIAKAPGAQHGAKTKLTRSQRNDA